MEGSGKQTRENTTKMELSTSKSCHFVFQMFGKVGNIVTEMIWGSVLRKRAAVDTERYAFRARQAVMSSYDCVKDCPETL